MDKLILIINIIHDVVLLFKVAVIVIICYLVYECVNHIKPPIVTTNYEKYSINGQTIFGKYLFN